MEREGEREEGGTFWGSRNVTKGPEVPVQPV